MRNNENSNMMVAAGLGLVALGGAIAYMSCMKRIDNLENTLNGITDGISKIAGDVDLTVPEDIVRTAMVMATNKATDRAVNSAVTEIKADVTKQMNDRITSTIKDVYESLEDDMKQKLTDKVNMTTLENIESQVSDKVAKEVMKTMISKVNSLGGNSGASSKADVAKFLAEKHYATWQIKDILDSMD